MKDPVYIILGKPIYTLTRKGEFFSINTHIYQHRTHTSQHYRFERNNTKMEKKNIPTHHIFILPLFQNKQQTLWNVRKKEFATINTHASTSNTHTTHAHRNFREEKMQRNIPTHTHIIHKIKLVPNDYLIMRTRQIL